MEQTRPHKLLPLSMNQNCKDLSNQSSESVSIKEIEVPMNVGDMIEY